MSLLHFCRCSTWIADARASGQSSLHSDSHKQTPVPPARRRQKNIHHHHHFVSIYVCFFGSPTSCDLEATWYNQSLPLFPAHSEAATLIAPPPIHQAPICLGVRLNKKGHFSHSKWLHMAKKDEFIRIGGGAIGRITSKKQDLNPTASTLVKGNI